MDCWRSCPLLPATPMPTLVLDMDGTLIDASNGDVVCKRPGVDDFLRSMAKRYQLVLWTSSQKAYASWVMEAVEADGPVFTHKLSGHDLPGDEVTKDLRRLGRDMRRLVMVDDDRYSIAPEVLANTIIIEKFQCDEGEEVDDAGRLPRLAKLLESMVAADDFREALGCMRERGDLDGIEQADYEEDEPESSESDDEEDEEDEEESGEQPEPERKRKFVEWEGWTRSKLAKLIEVTDE